MRLSYLVTTGLLAGFVVLWCLPAVAIDSDLPSPEEVLGKLKSFLPETDGIGSVSGDDDQTKPVVLLLILLGIALVAMALFGGRNHLGCAFGGFPLLLLGIAVTFFLWWLFPVFPYFLLLIPLVMIRAMRTADHDVPSTPAHRSAPAERPTPSASSSYPERPSTVVGFGGSWRGADERDGNGGDSDPTEHPGVSAPDAKYQPPTRNPRRQQ